MFQFTRYLYDKREVEYSLLLSLLSKKESAFFWGYELFHSGLIKDLKMLLYKIYYIFYYSKNYNMEIYFISEILNDL